MKKFERKIRVMVYNYEKENTFYSWKQAIVSEHKTMEVKNLVFHSAESAAEWFLSQPWDKKVWFINITELLYVDGWCESCLVSSIIDKDSNISETIVDIKKQRGESLEELFSSKL